MKRKMLKRTWNIVFLFVFLFVSVMSFTMPDVANAAADFVLTHDFTGTLTKGEQFDLPIRMRNLTDDQISNVELDFSASSIVALSSGGTIVPVTSVTVDKDELDKPLVTLNDLRFIGDGSSGLLTIKVNYNKAGTPTTATASLYLNVEQESDTNPEPIDTTKYKPNLTLTAADNTTVTAGLETFAKMTLKNISSSTYAKNVTITHVYDKDSPFNQTKILSESPIPEVKTGESKEIRMNITADKYAASGIYPLTLKITYMNPWNNEYSSEVTVYIKIENLNSETKLALATKDNIRAVAGKSFTMPVTMTNTGAYLAKDITVTLTGLSQDSFTLSSGTSRLVLGTISGHSFKEFNLELIAASSLRSGSYPVSFKIDYTNEKGDKVSDEQQIWIPLSGSGDQASQVEVLEVKSSMTTVSTSDIFDVSVKIKNSGSLKVDQLKVSADGTAALLPVTQNLFIVSALQPGETKTLTFKFQPSPDAPRGSVPIVIKVDNLDGQSGSISQAVSVFIDSAGGEQAGKNVPKIIVKSYAADPSLVKAGEKFNLSIEFLNTHSSKTIRNIKGNFSVNEGSNETGNVFTPVECSNTFYIDEINPKGTHNWDLTLYTIPDAKSKTYMVTISFEYEDDQGNAYKADEIIGIPVYQPSRFEMSEISLPPDTMMGQPIYLAFQMYNMGKTDIYNVRMTVEGDFDAQPKSSYFGNFESGRQEYCEINLIPMTVGQAKGKIIVTYESASGDVQTYEKEFSMNVMDMPPMDPGFPVDGGKEGPIGPGMPGMEEEPVKGVFFGSVWFFIIIGAVVVSAVVIIIVVRKRKKDKEFEF